ncbi:hypothetical protein [Bacillus sp. OTU530]|uniref:hypothetical protein n=1 Tax=Bacillus sp. OTU530 TaxID=3043862 RepID=UPI00313EF7E5
MTKVNKPTEFIIKPSSNSANYQRLRNIVKFMIIEDIKRDLAEEKEMERRNNNKQDNII